jgi:hypothetical protein
VAQVVDRLPSKHEPPGKKHISKKKKKKKKKKNLTDLAK